MKIFIQRIYSFKKTCELFIQQIYSFKKIGNYSFNEIFIQLKKWVIAHPYAMVSMFFLHFGFFCGPALTFLKTIDEPPMSMVIHKPLVKWQWFPYKKPLRGKKGHFDKNDQNSKLPSLLRHLVTPKTKIRHQKGETGFC